jgi:DNA polymerase-3 subunit alpha
MAIKVKKFNHNNQELAIRFGLGAIKAVGLKMVDEICQKRDQDGKFIDIYDFASRSGTKFVNKKSIEALAKSGAFGKIHQNRRQIFQSQEILSRFASQQERERSNPQMSLFGGEMGLEDKKPDLIKCDDWEKKEKLEKEFEAFGFFPNEHPTEDYIGDLQRRGVLTSEFLESEAKNDQIIKLFGSVAYSKHKSSAKGRYSYLTMSDPYGIYEASIFDDELITKSRDIMADGTNLVLEVLIKKDDGGIRILVKNIIEMVEFIKHIPAKKEAFFDIKINKKKSFNKDNYKKKDPNFVDPLQIQHKKDEELKKLQNKDILDHIELKINKREDIFIIKSFLSNKIPKIDFEKKTKIYVLIESKNQITKILLDDSYILDQKEFAELKLQLQ